jgi:hypothetical protein
MSLLGHFSVLGPTARDRSGVCARHGVVHHDLDIFDRLGVEPEAFANRRKFGTGHCCGDICREAGWWHST